ncbi:MAG: hypothetical protein MZU97_13795 [Bacillus subtilis]|nr:hypothetical protein [Bacillus subtilis]
MELANAKHAELIEARRRIRRRPDDQVPRWRRDRRRRHSSRRSARRSLTVQFFPVLCGSSFKNKGVQPMLDAVIDYLPSPGRSRRRSKDIRQVRPTKSSSNTTTPMPFVALAFKIMTDPFVGRLDLLPRLLRDARNQAPTSQYVQRQQRTHRPPASDARQPPRRNRRGLLAATSPPPSA